MSEQRGPARKPDVRVVAKLKQDRDGRAVYVDIGAWWREDGKTRGGWDRGIVAVKIADGRVLRCEDAYLNLQEQRQDAPRSAPRAVAAAPKDDGPDFGDDNLPF